MYGNLWATRFRLAMNEVVGSLPLPDVKAFRHLIRAQGKKSTSSAYSRFVKRLESISNIVPTPEQPRKVALLLVDKGLFGQFTGLWPSPKLKET